MCDQRKPGPHGWRWWERDALAVNRCSNMQSVSEGRSVCCSMSQRHDSVSQGRVCSDNFSCCHTETEVADQTLLLTGSQYTDTGPTSPSADPTPSGAGHVSHWSANFEVTGMTRPGKIPTAQAGFEPGIFRSRGGRLNHRADEALS